MPAMYSIPIQQELVHTHNDYSVTQCPAHGLCTAPAEVFPRQKYRVLLAARSRWKNWCALALRPEIQ